MLLDQRLHLVHRASQLVHGSQRHVRLYPLVAVSTLLQKGLGERVLLRSRAGPKEKKKKGKKKIKKGKKVEKENEREREEMRENMKVREEREK